MNKKFVAKSAKQKGLTAKQVIAKLRSKSADSKDETEAEKVAREAAEAKAKEDEDAKAKEEADAKEAAEAKAKEDETATPPETKEEDEEQAPTSEMEGVIAAIAGLTEKIDMISEGLAMVLENAGLMESDMSEEDKETETDEEESEEEMDEEEKADPEAEEEEDDMEDEDEEKSVDAMSDDEAAAALEATIAELEKFE